MKTIPLPGTTHRLRELNHALPEQKDEAATEGISLESALREAGVDERLIAEKLTEQLEANRPRWNPRKNAFELFPDYRARFAALMKTIEILGGVPSENGEGNLIVVMDGITPKKPRDDTRDVGERSERSSPNLDEQRTAPKTHPRGFDQKMENGLV